MPLSETEILFSTLAQSSSDCIKLFDVRGKLIFINTSGLREHGYKDVEDAAQRDFADTMVPESRDHFKKAFSAALHGDPASLEIHHTEEGANREFCLENFTPIRDKSGVIVGVLGISRDISLRKRMEEELRERIDDLEKVNKLMVGRELKMMELKNTIEELKQKVASS
ncbi:MAG: PAS domain-containing protein [Candidatus Paceibacterota bacterium]|jgi:PAS domain S-box-containing protein